MGEKKSKIGSSLANRQLQNIRELCQQVFVMICILLLSRNFAVACLNLLTIE